MENQEIELTPNQIKPNKKNSIVFVIGIILIMVLIAGISYLLIDRFYSKSQIKKDPLSVENEPTIDAAKSKEIKNIMKTKLKLVLSNPPSPVPIDPYPKFTYDLPPVGEYCNGCKDSAPGWWNKTVLSGSSWISGEYTSSNSDKKWNFISYIFKGKHPELPNDGFVIPSGNFFKEVVGVPVGSSKSFVDVSYGDSEATLTYQRLNDQTIDKEIKAYMFDVKPTFYTGFIGRKEAIFVKDNYTILFMFDWKDHKFDNTFDKIISSIKFEKK